MFFDEIQDSIAPGYREKLLRKAEREQGRTQWWGMILTMCKRLILRGWCSDGGDCIYFGISRHPFICFSSQGLGILLKKQKMS